MHQSLHDDTNWLEHQVPARIQFSIEALEQQFLLVIVSANLPFTVVKDPEVINLIRLLHPNAHLSRRKRIRDLLASQYGEIQQDLLPGLGHITKVSIFVDCWISPNSLAFLAIVCYYVAQDWEYKEILLEFEPVSGSHTGQNLAQVVKQVLLRHNLCHRLLAVTHNNASNNNTLQQSLGAWLNSQQVPWNLYAI